MLGKENNLINKIVSEINKSEIEKLVIVNSTDKITRTLINQLQQNPLLKMIKRKIFDNSQLLCSQFSSAKESYLSDKNLISTN